MTSGGFPSDNVALNQHYTLLSCVFTCQMTGLHDATAPLMERLPLLWESLHVLGVHLRVQVSVDGMDHLGKYLPH